MKRFSLFSKFLLLYLVAALSMFILLNTAGVNLMQKRMLERTKEELYQDATMYVSGYLSEYYKKNVSYLDLMSQFELLGDMMDARIWMLGKNGIIIMDSQNYGTRFVLTEAVPDFLETTFRENFYVKGLVNEPMLCVTVPVIHEYENRGYLVLSVPMSRLEKEAVFYVDFSFFSRF